MSSSDGPDHFEEYKKNSNKHFFITNEEGCSYRTMFERYLLNYDIHDFQTMDLMEYRSYQIDGNERAGICCFALYDCERRSGERQAGNPESLRKVRPDLIPHADKKWLSPAVEAFVELVLDSMKETEKGVL
ncbi:hypothetical protein SAMN05216352_106239 [Alteribacillus bidgolensis]|uniref:Uncharacterized protein n=1 Tax=Alteribacillus bidgolensis TaxID=930129 RepID=A0A1G8JLJ8_9BACI|nr:hypothetical protein SAMN05216352_106239 [Alteribacillus bidgolensis]